MRVVPVVVCVMASVCQAACNKIVGLDTMSVVDCCVHVMQPQLGTAHQSHQARPAPRDTPCVAQEKKDDSADLDGSDWTIPAEVGVLEGVRGAAPADNALPQGLLQGEDSSAAHMVSDAAQRKM